MATNNTSTSFEYSQLPVELKQILQKTTSCEYGQQKTACQHRSTGKTIRYCIHPAIVGKSFSLIAQYFFLSLWDGNLTNAAPNDIMYQVIHKESGLLVKGFFQPKVALICFNNLEEAFAKNILLANAISREDKEKIENLVKKAMVLDKLQTDL